MKKIVLILLLAIGVSTFKADAQITSLTATSYTVTDAGTVSLIAVLSQPYQYLGFQFVGTKVSGTIAGTVVLQGSLDGTNYINVGSSFTQTDVTTNTWLWEIDDNPYLYYKILVTGSGTMVQTCSATVMRRQ